MITCGTVVVKTKTLLMLIMTCLFLEEQHFILREKKDVYFTSFLSDEVGSRFGLEANNLN